MKDLLDGFYRLLLYIAALFMVATLLAILLGIAGRQFGFNIAGLDGYAGYSIAAALFLALPATLRSGDHIRVTLLLNRLQGRPRQLLEYWCLVAASGLSAYLAWYSVRLVHVSLVMHDVAGTSDATPLWIPQIAMALGGIGLMIAYAEELICKLTGEEILAQAAGEMARTE